MRPSLSPFEYGAYGTPSTRASVVVGGPHVSSDGRAETIEEIEIGMLLYCTLKVCVLVFPVGQSSATLSNRNAYAKLITAILGLRNNRTAT